MPSRLYVRVSDELDEAANERAKELGFIKPSGDSNISEYLRHLIREDSKKTLTIKGYQHLFEVSGEVNAQDVVFRLFKTTKGYVINRENKDTCRNDTTEEFVLEEAIEYLESRKKDLKDPKEGLENLDNDLELIFIDKALNKIKEDVISYFK